MKFCIALLALMTSLSSFSSCALNMEGDDICSGQKALLKTQEIDQEFEVVKVRYINIRNEVAITDKTGRRIVNTDALIGSSECDLEGRFCEREKVKVRQECLSQFSKNKVSVTAVFSNEIVQVKDGIFSKPRLALKECFDSI